MSLDEWRVPYIPSGSPATQAAHVNILATQVMHSVVQARLPAELWWKVRFLWITWDDTINIVFEGKSNRIDHITMPRGTHPDEIVARIALEAP